MDIALHIPWTNEALEKLLLEVIKTGEATKVDFKTSCDLVTAGQKAELARDIQAIANSSDVHYYNYGFVVIGAKPGALTATSFAQGVDQMQATVDQIVREHIGPFVHTHVRHFANGQATWGVIVISPSRNAPHIFIRDTASFHRGDVWIRVGTTSSKAAPEDFARFYRVHLDDVERVFREEIGELRREITRVARQRHWKTARESTASPTNIQSVSTGTPSEGDAESEMALVDVVRRMLKESADPVSVGLEREAASLRHFLESDAIAWDLNNISKESGRSVMEQLTERTAPFWMALAVLIEYDDEGKYTRDVVEALSLLAFEPESPSGKAFTRFGTGIRLFPLAMAMYIVFMIGLRKKRHVLLAEVAKSQMSPRTYSREESLPIGTALFYVRDASEVLQAMRDDYPDQRWCDSVGSYAQLWIASNLYPELPKMARQPEMFYVAEFVLSLLSAAAENIAQPAAGLFYFVHGSASPIQRFLKNNEGLLDRLFGNKVKTILERFDEWGPRMATSGRCWGDGFQRGAVNAVFPEAKALER